MRKGLLIALLMSAVVGGVESLAGERRPVDPDKLRATILTADRMVVVHADRGEGDTETTLFQSSSPADIRQFAEALVLEVPEETLVCLCDDPLEIHFFAGRELLLRVTNHGAQTISSSTWDSEAVIADPEAFLAWFDQRSIAQPREEYERSKLEAVRFQAAQRRWLEAMPTSLRPYWPKMQDPSGGPSVEELLASLSQEVSSAPEQILVILNWFGSGMGPWSGFPAYEEVAEELLLTYATPQLLQVVESHSLSDNQAEGAARLFGGWSFSQKRPGDRLLLSPRLKARLLNQALRSRDDEDKIARAERAFRDSQ